MDAEFCQKIFFSFIKMIMSFLFIFSTCYCGVNVVQNGERSTSRLCVVTLLI